MINAFCTRIALFTLLLLIFSACTEPQAAKNEGQLLTEQNKLPEALTWYNKKIGEEKSPLELKNLYYGRAVVHRKMRKTELAINDLNWALVIDSANTKYIGEIGDIYYEKFQPQDAQFQYQRNVNLEPKNGFWLYKTGKCRLLSEDIAGAINDLEKAEKLGYTESDLYLQLGISYHRTGNLEKCCALFKKSAGMGNKEAEMLFKNLRCS